VKIDNLSAKSQIYTSNVYLLTGDWNCMEDVNTLVDVGRDHNIIDKIYQASTGVGKSRIEQVILTHNHYDHASLLPNIKNLFHPQVYAYSSYLEGVDRYVKGGELIKVADRLCEIIYTPGHSNDSICLYCPEEKILFAGDTPLIIRTVGGSYEERFIKALEYICKKDIQIIYFGHGDPLIHGCKKVLLESLANVRKSPLIRNQQGGSNNEVVQ
jgi:glyoxylase-like metal-dependent hydrolase (beta-lactamase superfamily II)